MPLMDPLKKKQQDQKVATDQVEVKLDEEANDNLGMKAALDLVSD